ncbi:MAG: N-acetyltransferase [Chloroflexi bacterium]|nr:MAG: N-acetyltransferase [Chloroflexota bacterium]
MMENKITILRTTRLALRPLQIGDVEALHRIYQYDGVLRYFPNPIPPPLEKVERFIASQQGHWEKFGYGNWGILPEGEQVIVGWAGLQFIPELNETEVGFLFEPRCWGKGYATEVARASLQFGFERANLDHIIALVHPDNIASRRVIEKCEMQYQETIFLWGIDLMRFRLSFRPEHGPVQDEPGT